MALILSVLGGRAAVRQGPCQLARGGRRCYDFVPNRPCDALAGPEAVRVRERSNEDETIDSFDRPSNATCETAPMNESESCLCDADTMAGLLETMARSIVEQRYEGAALRLVGVRTRGVPIARRLAGLLEPMVGEKVLVGAVDITLYRDDLGQGDRWPVLRGTEVPFQVDGVEIILVDDVLFTGRTVRAALNAVCDLGRPECIRLAVLIERNHRELPVQPDVVGLHVATERGERVRVRVTPVDPVDEVVRVSGS
jgi:pyrimidine operon attenuation protein/uracil phosphoribosyltransferase